MPAEGLLTGAERQLVIDRRLDELDRALLGLLPRAERLAVMANVEARLVAIGDEAPIATAEAVELPEVAPGSMGGRVRSRRSRLAFSAGVLGIVAAATLLISPLLFVGLSIVSEAVGEFIAISMMTMFSLLLAAFGVYAVCGGGVSIFRLAGRAQSATGTGWAITGLCTGAVPMLVGLCFLLSVVGPLMESQMEVTWNAAPSGNLPPPGYAQPVDYPQAALMPAQAYGAPYSPAPVMPLPAGPPVPAGMPVPMMPMPALPSQLPLALPPDARTITPSVKEEPKANAATKPEGDLLPAAPPAVKENEAEAED